MSSFAHLTTARRLTITTPLDEYDLRLSQRALSGIFMRFGTGVFKIIATLYKLTLGRMFHASYDQEKRWLSRIRQHSFLQLLLY